MKCFDNDYYFAFAKTSTLTEVDKRNFLLVKKKIKTNFPRNSDIVIEGHSLLSGMCIMMVEENFFSPALNKNEELILFSY